jgi:hypothetical protein
VTGPAAFPPGVDKTHIVKVGDTLGAIAQQHLGNAGDYVFRGSCEFMNSRNNCGITPPPTPPTGGFGAQSHGSRKGLGGDLPNDPHKRRGAPRRADDTTNAQIADMQSEGPGQP